MTIVKVGLIGAGTVGGGVIEVLQRQHNFFLREFGLDIRLTRIAEKDASKTQNLKFDGVVISQNADDVIRDPEIQIVVELVGGIGIAKDIILKSIESGKHVVTANKHLLAKFGHEIFPAADKRTVSIYFEGSVGGGMPIIKALRESLVANDIENIRCIINGTTNYILTRMRREKKSFAEILTDAQKLGYAEADPAFDIDGIDAAHKVAIMASLAYGCWVNIDDIYIEGIRNITAEDVAYAEDLGYVVKLLGVIRNRTTEIEARVHPALLPREHLLANVDGVYNGVALIGDAAGSILMTGKGAGRYPTASAVVSDIVDICRNIASNAPLRAPMSFYCPEKRKKVKPILEVESRYYFRFTVIDKPGVLGKLTGVLGNHQISIASVVQKERAPHENVPVIFLTHHAKEKAVRDAIREIDKLDVVKQPTQIIRIEQEEESGMKICNLN